MIRRDRALLLLAALPLALVTLACGGVSGGAAVTGGARWACPSPEPRPWGTAGPVKDVIRHTRPISEGGDWEERIYYEQWEQEYPHAPGPPFPSPTPYALVGNSYALGQRVEVWPLHLRVTARGGPPVDLPGAPPGGRQLQFVTLEWVNHTEEAIPVSYARQVVVQSIREARGGLVSGDGWRVSPEALRLGALDPPPERIPPGASDVTLPILTPPGAVATVAVAFRTASAPAAATPTPNAELRSPRDAGLTVLWTDTAPHLGDAPLCEDPGALTAWGGEAWGIGAPPGLRAPAGDARVVQIAASRVGRRYVWGARGPETFDCQGLMVWSYAQVGITIVGGSRNQYAALRPVALGDMRPGDLVFFDTRTSAEGWRGAPQRVTHVGMVADLDGDGRWDLIHAASRALGVRVESNFLASRYYAPRMFGEARTVR